MKLWLQELTQCWTDSDNGGQYSHQKLMLERRGQQKSLQWYRLNSFFWQTMPCWQVHVHLHAFGTLLPAYCTDKNYCNYVSILSSSAYTPVYIHACNSNESLTRVNPEQEYLRYSLHMSQVAYQAGAYVCFCSMKQLGVFLLLLDGMLVQAVLPP